MPAMKKQVTILGGGLAGMSCAVACVRAGAEVMVLEREDRVGGLARSFTEEGYTYDLGPHRLLIHTPEVVSEFNSLLGQSLLLKERKSRIFLKGRFFHYPLRVGNAIFSMPPAITARILADYAWAKARSVARRGEDKSFEDWVVARFGRTLFNIFFKQYTEKAWGIPCSQISADWASQRISLLSLWDTLVKSLWRRGDQPRTYASQFYYPLHGGIGSISSAMASEVEASGGEVACGRPVTALKVAGDRVKTIQAGDLTIEPQEVVSTIPLNDLVGMTDGADESVGQAASNLRFRAIVFVYLFVKRPRISDDHWIYLPEEQFISNRFSEAVNFSMKNAPMGKTVLCAEITCDVGDSIWNTSDDVLAERVVADLIGLGFTELSHSEILKVATHRVKEAYPIYDIGYQQRVKTVLDFGESLSNFIAIGRSALFRYNNMDHSVAMGEEAAALVLGKSGKKITTRIATDQKYFG
jgi:protoporphyrinogen oxidase